MSTEEEDGIGGLSSAGRTRILEETRFTASEVDELWYRTGAHTTMDRTNFDNVLASSTSSNNEVLLNRLWDMFDSNDDGEVETVEFIIALGRLTKGTLDETIDLFFELYDVDNNNQLSEDEIVNVYCALLFSSGAPAVGEDGTADKSGQVLVWTEEKKQAEEQRIRNITKNVILAEDDTDKNGMLDKEEFRALVKRSYDEQAKQSKGANNSFAAILRALGLIAVVSFAELGTSFAVQNVGALSGAFKERFNADDGDIGLFTGMYYISAAFGAVAFGILLDIRGAPFTLLTSNSVVLVGCVVQAVAAVWYPNFFLLCVARFIIGIGGEATMFSSVESLSVLFPNNFTVMAGYRNLVQSSFGFLAFSTLPTIQDFFGGAAFDSGDTSAGLGETMWVICVFVGISIGANILVLAYIRISTAAAKIAQSSNAADRINIASSLRSWTTNLTPQAPRKCGDWVMPLGFYFSIYAIQSFYFALFSFTAFSVKIFSERNGLDVKQAAFMSGLPSLIAGILGPITAPLTDILGRRSLLLSVSLLPTTIGFVVLVFSTSPLAVYIFVGLSSLAYGIGDTVAFIAIRMIVGAERAGKGYAIQALGGNLLSFAVPAVGGIIINHERGGDTAVLWYFVGLHVVGSLAWLGVRCTVDSKSPLELPAKDLIETSDEQINAAALQTKFMSSKPVVLDEAEATAPVPADPADAADASSQASNEF